MAARRNDNDGAGTTLLVLVVDRSGSMQSIRADMEGGIKTLLLEQAAAPGICLVTMAQFDTEYEMLFQAIPAQEVTGYQLVPRGGTALLDAIGRTIGEVRHWMDALPAERRPDQVLFAVVTDGEENSSREWSRRKVMDAVRERSEVGWQFSFLGANQDAIKEGANLGVAPGAAMTYDASAGGVRGAMSALSASMRRVRTGESATIAYTDDERRHSAGS